MLQALQDELRLSPRQTDNAACCTEGLEDLVLDTDCIQECISVMQESTQTYVVPES